MSLCIYPPLKHKLGFFLFQWDTLCILPGVVPPGTLDLFIIMISASEQLITNLVILLSFLNWSNPASSHHTLS